MRLGALEATHIADDRYGILRMPCIFCMFSAYYSVYYIDQLKENLCQGEP